MTTPDIHNILSYTVGVDCSTVERHPPLSRKSVVDMHARADFLAEDQSFGTIRIYV